MGWGDDARLQHPLGVAYDTDGILYVADTYNNKIKRIELAKSRIETFAGSGQEGRADGGADEASFDEPAGMSIADGKIYVADTNNHLIRVVDIKSKKVSTLTIMWD